MIISCQLYRLLTAPLLVVLYLAWHSPAAAQSIDIEAAKKDGKVIVYAAVPPQTMKVINDPFEKKYGIKVEYWRASATGILDGHSTNGALAQHPSMSSRVTKGLNTFSSQKESSPSISHPRRPSIPSSFSRTTSF